MKPIVLLSLLLLFAVPAKSAELARPDPLVLQDGRKLSSQEQWKKQRRLEILELFRTHVYGRTPVGRPASLTFEMVETTPNAMDGLATRQVVRIAFQGPGGRGALRLVLFLPNAPVQPVPCFLLICNRGEENMDSTRARKSEFWPAETLVARGYAAAAFQVADLDPDQDDGFRNGVHGIFDSPQGRGPDAWGTIAAWAWGASRAMDFLETQPRINRGQVAVVGHSRGGKTALWAGAEDERFALVVSNDSGSTGAAMARGKKGETIRDINRNFPHWFCENYKRFNDRENELPVDQHMLAALIAPRLLYIASATEDAWADPAQEFLAASLASPVYEFLGRGGLVGREKGLPKANTPLQAGAIGYHLRSGKHDLTAYDWNAYLDFADQKWTRGVPSSRVVE